MGLGIRVNFSKLQNLHSFQDAALAETLQIGKDSTGQVTEGNNSWVLQET